MRLINYKLKEKNEFFFVFLPKNGLISNFTPISHDRTSVHFLVQPNCLFSITETTEYSYFRPIQTINQYKNQRD